MTKLSLEKIEKLISEPKKISTGMNGIKFLVVEGSEDCKLTLRGQPNKSSNMTVCRCSLGPKYGWDVNSSYHWDAIVCQTSHNLQIEGVVENVTSLFMHSVSKGWYEINIVNGNFSGKNTYCPWDNGWKTLSPKTPKDIDIVFAYNSTK